MLRVVDTTAPTAPLTELDLLLYVNTSLRPVTSDNEYNYDLTDMSAALGVESGLESLEAEDPETVKSSTKRRFEFVNSSNLVQSEIYLKNTHTPGHLGDGSEVPAPVCVSAMDHTHLIMPIHRILSVFCKKIVGKALSQARHMGTGPESERNSQDTDVLVSIIGAGGFALPSHLLAVNHSLPEGRALTVHAVEPEEKVLRAARDFFGAVYTMAGEDSGTDTTHRSSSAHVVAYGTDGLTYLQDLSASRILGSDRHGGADVLIIDAFEETPPPGFGPAGSYSNRAPPCSLISNPSLFVNCLRPCMSGREDSDSGDSSDSSDGSDSGERRERRESSDKEGLLSLESTLSSTGGVLVINLFGPQNWIEEVFNAVQSCPGLSSPVLVRIKGEKNVLLVSSRTSGV